MSAQGVLSLVLLHAPSRGPQFGSPAIVPFVDALLSYARRIGGTFVVTSGYRSAAQQADLLARWMRGDKSVVYPPAQHSYHEYGLAVDIESNRLSALGAYAKTIGMRWGGDFGDPVHFDLGRR